MAKSYEYMPTNMPDFIIWLKNFVTRLPDYQGYIGATPAEITQFQKDLDWLEYFANTSVQIKTFRSDYADIRKAFENGKIDENIPLLMPPDFSAQPATPTLGGLRKRIRKAVGRYTRAKDYTVNMGEALGIIPAKQDDSIASLKPEPKSVVGEPDDKVCITFVKRGKADALQVEMQREGETKWTRTGTPNFSPFMDTTPSLNNKAEKRMYRFRYLIKNVAVGEYSEIYPVVTNP